MLPAIFTMSCSTADWADTDVCIGERFLLNGNGGGITYHGASGIAWGYGGSGIVNGLAGEMDWRFFKAVKDNIYLDNGYAGVIWAQAITEYVQNHDITHYEPGYGYLDWKTVAEYGTLLGDPTIKYPQPQAPDFYTDYNELTAYLTWLNTTYPDLVEVFSIATTWEGRKVWACRLTNENTGLDKPTSIIVGGHHGNEFIGMETVIYFINQTIENYGTNPTITYILDNAIILTVPMLNPDGRTAESRYNAHDVDLNRNYPYSWDPSHEPHAGPAPLSEPETQGLMNLVAQYPIYFALDMHSGAECMVYPWDSILDPPPHEEAFIAIAEDMINATESQGYQCTPPAGWEHFYKEGSHWYLVWGSWIEELYGAHTAPSGAPIIPYVIEVYGNGYNPPTEQEKNKVCQKYYWMQLEIAIKTVTTTDAAATVKQLPENVKPGETVSFKASAVNIGTQAIAGCQLQFYVNGTLEQTIDIASLNSMQNSTHTIQWTPPAEGTYNLTIYIPPLPGETRKANNKIEKIVKATSLTILIVSDDDAGSGGDGTSLSEFQQALDNLGYTYATWKTSTDGTPTLQLLEQYDIVIWTCGDLYGGTIDDTEQQLLGSYVFGGGCLLLEGDDIGYDHQGTTDWFMTSVAHAVWKDDHYNSAGTYVTVIEDHPITQGLPSQMYLSGGNGCPWPDEVQPVNGSIALMGYSDWTYYSLTAYNGSNGDGRVVYMAFSLDGLEQAYQQQLVGNIVEWLKPEAWTDVPVARSLWDQARPDIAANGSRIYMAYEDARYGNWDIVFAWSTDGGQTWRRKRLTLNPADQRHPRITVSGGRIYIVYENNRRGNWDICVLWSDNYGASWQGKRLTGGTGNERYPDIAAYGSSVYVVFQGDKRGSWDIYMDISHDNAQTWTGRRRSWSTADETKPSIAAYGSSVYLAYQGDKYGSWDIYFQASMDQGQTWSARRLTFTAESQVNATIAAYAGDVYVAYQTWGSGWDIALNISHDNGQTWAGRAVASTTSSETDPSLYVEGSSVYIAYVVDGDVWLARSGDKAQTLASSPVVWGAGSQLYPSVSGVAPTVIAYQTDENGNLDVHVAHN